MTIYRGGLPDGMEQKALLNMRAGEITETAIKIAAKKLGKKISNEDVRAIRTADPKERYIKLREHLGKDATGQLVRATGKVGFIVSPASGHGGDVFAITDERYGNDAKYTKAVNQAGATPDFVKKLEKTKGRPDHLDERIDALAAKSKIYNKSGSPTKAYLQEVIKLKDKIPIDVFAMKRSLTRIKDGTETTMTAERSVQQGIRFALINQAQETTKGKMCRMLGTTAAEPDFEHSLLEGEIMPCEEVLEHLSRWGCQHNYEIIDD